MSPDTDRIAVPTNGRGPHPAPEPAPAMPAPARPVVPEPSPGPAVPFTPTQLAVGFGILAAVVALLARGLRRRGRAGRRGPLGHR